MTAPLLVRCAAGTALLTLALTPAQAQTTTCSIAGDYVLTATLMTVPPAQVGGTIVFTPSATGAADAPGTADLQVAYASTAGTNTLSLPALTYRVSGSYVTIGDGLLIGALGSIVGGLETSVPINGDGGLRLAGMPVRRTIDGLTGSPGPTVRPDRPAWRDLRVLSVRSARPAPVVLLVRSARLVRPVPPALSAHR